MRKLGRILRRVLTALSLLLFVAVVVAWVRGYWSCDHINVTRESLDDVQWRQEMYGIKWSSGELLFYMRDSSTEAMFARITGYPSGILHKWKFVGGEPVRLRQHYLDVVVSVMPHYKHLGFFDKGGVVGIHVTLWSDQMSLSGKLFFGDSGVRLIAFPCWMAAIVFGTLPSWRCFVWWRGVRRRRLATREGRCGVCGYDLRASPERCPECGTAVGAKDHHGATEATEKKAEKSHR